MPLVERQDEDPFVQAMVHGVGSLRRAFDVEKNQHAACLLLATIDLEQPFQVLARRPLAGMDPASAKSPANGFTKEAMQASRLHVFLGGSIRETFVGLFFADDEFTSYPIELIRRGMPVQGTWACQAPTVHWLEEIHNLITPEMRDALARKLQQAAAEPVAAAAVAAGVKRRLGGVKRRAKPNPEDGLDQSTSTSSSHHQTSSSSSSLPAQVAYSSSASAAFGSGGSSTSRRSPKVSRRG